MATLFLIDGNAVAYRAFFAIKDLSTSYGQPTNAIFGFVNMLNRLIKEHNPDFLACAFDSPGKTFRHRVFEEYKVNRPGTPERLASQFPLIKEVLSAYRIPVLEEEGLEADDILNRVARVASEKGFFVFIVTADKDLLQLVNERIKVIHPQTYQIFDHQKVIEKFGLPPERIPDLMALTGDPIDNIPGVKGIGEKTAIPLIKEFGSIENLYQNLDRVKSDWLRQKLEEGRESASLSKRLATLPVCLTEAGETRREREGFDPESFRLKEPDKDSLARLFRRLEFKKLLSEIAAAEDTDYLLFVSGKTFSGKVIDLSQILSDPKPYLGSLTSPEVVKAGFNLKEKLHQLRKVLRPQKVDIGPLFDFAVAAALCEKQPLQSDHEAIYHFFSRELKALGLEHLFYQVEMPLLPILADMEETGVFIDILYLKELGRHFETLLADLSDQIFRLAGQPFNLNSPSQLAKILFEDLKLPVGKKTKTGFSTDSSVLESLSAFHPIVPLILKYRQISKLNSTYVQTLPNLVSPEDGRLHTTFNPIGTITGRLSSEKPNLQNIPLATPEGSSIRRAFCRQKEGYLLCSFDYSQIELRILAHLSGDRLLRQAFLEDRDIHSETARVLFHKAADPKEEASLLEITPQERRIAKTVNFGVFYGMSAFGLSQQLNISPEEAQRFINAYFDRYSGVKEFLERTIQFAREDGYVTTILGRRRSLPGIKSQRANERLLSERFAVNTPVQGSAADIIKLAMVKITPLLTRENFQGKIVLQIHDELLFEIPEGELKPLATVVKEVMENVLSLSVPLKVSVKAGLNWQEMKEVKEFLK